MPIVPHETEAGFTAAVLQLAKLRGWRRAHFRPGRVKRGGVWKYETAIAGDGKGWPDLVLVRGGRLVVAELKTAAGRLTEEQEAWLEAFRLVGAEVFTWRPADWPAIVAAIS